MSRSEEEWTKTDRPVQKTRQNDTDADHRRDDEDRVEERIAQANPEDLIANDALVVPGPAKRPLENRARLEGQQDRPHQRVEHEDREEESFGVRNR